MFFIVLLLTFPFRANQCYKFPEAAEPFPELIDFFEIISADLETDVFVEFVFADSSLYEAYFTTLLRFAKVHTGTIALHLNMNDFPLRAFSDHVLLTDSFETLG